MAGSELVTVGSETVADGRLDRCLDTLKHLVRYPSVVGAERSFFRVLQRELVEAGARVTLFEGLLVAEGPRPDAAYCSAHVDRHGLVCTGPNEFQYAAFVTRNRGDLHGNSVSEQTYQLLAGRFHGEIVQAYEPWTGGYLGQGAIQNSFVCPRRGNLVFELDGLRYLLPGTSLAYLDRVTIRDQWVTAQLDNVLSVAILVQAYREGFPGTVFLTAEEEVGRSWRYLLEWFRRYGRTSRDLVVLDTSPFPDEVSVAQQDVVLRHRDVHAEFATEAVDRLRSLCDDAGIRYTFKDELLAEMNAAVNADRLARGLPPQSIGSTEMGRLTAASEGEVTGATLQIPTTGYHTVDETTTTHSIRHALDLVLQLGEQ